MSLISCIVLKMQGTNEGRLATADVQLQSTAGFGGGVATMEIHKPIQDYD